MEVNNNLQKRLHEVRYEIIKIELEIEDLMTDKDKNIERILELQLKLKELKNG